MIRDCLVCGINNDRIQRHLLQEPSLTYESAFEKAQAMELAAQNVAHMTDSDPAPVYNIHNKSGTGKHSPTPVILLQWNAIAVEVIITLQSVASWRQHVEHVARKVTLLEFVVAQQKDLSRHQRNLSQESQAPHSLPPALIQTQSHSSLLTVYMKNHICWHLLLLCQTTHCLHFLLMPSPLLLQYK